MVWDWILGVVLRPGDTFERAREQLRFGYWWIVISVMTLEMVMALYSPPLQEPNGPQAATGDLVVVYAAYYLILFDLQALFLLVAAKVTNWKLSWPEALKYTGLTWAILFVEDVVGFYPALKGHHMLTMWLTVPFVLWFLVALAIGVRRVSGLSTGKALLVSLMAAGPWRIGLFIFNWIYVTRTLP